MWGGNLIQIKYFILYWQPHSKQMALNAFQFVVQRNCRGHRSCCSDYTKHQRLPCWLCAYICFHDYIWSSIHGSTFRWPWTINGEADQTKYEHFLTSVQVALERVKEYSELTREPPEFMEPRPPASWPSSGAISCEDLIIRYAVRLVISLIPSANCDQIARIAGCIAQAKLQHFTWWKGKYCRKVCILMTSLTRWTRLEF